MAFRKYIYIYIRKKRVENEKELQLCFMCMLRRSHGWMDGYDDCGLNFAPQISINNFFLSFFFILLCPYISTIYVKLKWEKKSKKCKRSASYITQRSSDNLLLGIVAASLRIVMKEFNWGHLQAKNMCCVSSSHFELTMADDWKPHSTYRTHKKKIYEKCIYLLKEKNVIQQLIWTPFGSRHKLAPSNIQCSF